MGNEVSLPGQELEKAAGEIISDAGKSLTAAIRRVGSTVFESAVAGIEARAEQRRLDIHHERQLLRDARSNDARREQQILELYHQKIMSEQGGSVYERGAKRLRSETILGQESVEFVIESAFVETQTTHRNAEPREIDDDWLSRFFRYTADVTDVRVLKVLSSALADAAVRDQPILPPKALDIVRFFDNKSYVMFKEMGEHVNLFGSVGHYYIEQFSGSIKLGFDLELMIEMGLMIEYTSKKFQLRIGNVVLTFSYLPGDNFEFPLVRLTQAGRAILGLISDTHKKYNKAQNELGFIRNMLVLQSDCGLSEKKLDILCDSLIGVMSDAWKIDMRAFRHDEKEQTGISVWSRDKIEEKFDISRVLGNFSSGEEKEYINIIVEKFDDFDRHTLPAIIDMSI